MKETCEKELVLRTDEKHFKIPTVLSNRRWTDNGQKRKKKDEGQTKHYLSFTKNRG